MSKRIEREIPSELHGEPFSTARFVGAVGVSRSTVYRLLRAGTLKADGTLGEAADAYRAWRVGPAGDAADAELLAARGVVYDGRRERELARLAVIEREHIPAAAAERIWTRLQTEFD